MTEILAEFRDVTKVYRSGFLMRPHRVLDGFHLAIEPGHIYGLLGPNGAGKTTALKLLMGLIRPDGGDVRVAGAAPKQAAARRNIGFLPENPSFYDYLNGGEFLDFIGRLAGLEAEERRRQVDELLERLDLGRVRHTAIRKYSKGMLQRLGLAQALIGQPRLLVLDEPMSGLDPVGRRLFRDVILAERDRGTTILFSSHILQDAELICDRVAILVNGRLRSLEDLGEKLSSRVLHYEVGVEGGDAAEGEGVQLIAREGDKLLLRIGDLDAAQAVLDRTRRDGGRVLSLAPGRESLEDIFLEEIADSGKEAS